MRRYKLWDRIEAINGVPAEHFLNKPPFKDYNGDIILIYSESGNKVSNIECKDILASIYEIDPTLELDDFMTEYFRKIEELQSENNKE